MFRELCAAGRRCGFSMSRLLKTAFTINNKVLKHLFKAFMPELFNPLNYCENIWVCLGTRVREGGAEIIRK